VLQQSAYIKFATLSLQNKCASVQLDLQLIEIPFSDKKHRQPLSCLASSVSHQIILAINQIIKTVTENTKLIIFSIT